MYSGPMDQKYINYPYFHFGEIVSLLFFNSNLYMCRANAFVDWKSLYDLGKSNNGTLTKETVRAVYDGSLFEQIAQEQASK